MGCPRIEDVQFLRLRVCVVGSDDFGRRRTLHPGSSGCGSDERDDCAAGQRARGGRWPIDGAKRGDTAASGSRRAFAAAINAVAPATGVCRNRLLDKLGTVGVQQVRAMSDVRFKEAAIEGKVPNTNNLRLDLRGSACDDPRIKATLYDFDGIGMLQSITYVWDRPAGPAPAPIFSERVTHLTRVLSLPPPQSPGRLQADTSVGRLIIEDLPERNLLLEAYKAKK